MKKLLALCLCLLMMLGTLTACTNSDPVVTPTPTPMETIEPSEKPEDSMMPDIEDGIIDEKDKVEDDIKTYEDDHDIDLDIADPLPEENPIDDTDIMK